MDDSSNKQAIEIRVILTRDMFPELYNEIVAIPVTAKMRSQRVLVLANNYLVSQQMRVIKAPVDPSANLPIIDKQPADTTPLPSPEPLEKPKEEAMDNKKVSSNAIPDFQVKMAGIDALDGAEDILSSIGALSFGGG